MGSFQVGEKKIYRKDGSSFRTILYHHIMIIKAAYVLKTLSTLALMKCSLDQMVMLFRKPGSPVV